LTHIFAFGLGFAANALAVNDLGLTNISVDRLLVLKTTDDTLKIQFVHCGKDYPVRVRFGVSLNLSVFSTDSGDGLRKLFPVLRCSRKDRDLDDEFAVSHSQLALSMESSSYVQQLLLASSIS
jgi:hypothetical protein